MAFSDDGQRLIAVSSIKEKGELNTWNTATGAEVQTRTLSTGKFYQAAFSPDRLYLATIDVVQLNGEVKIWDVASGQLAGAIPLARSGHDLAFSPDGKHLAIGAEVLIDSRLHGLAKICKVPSCEEVVSILDPGESFYRVAFHPQGRWLVTAHQQLKIWDLKPRLLNQ